MAQVQYLEIPDDLYGQIEELQTLQLRSIPEKIVGLLRQAIEVELRRQKQLQILESIRADRWVSDQCLDSVSVLREIRGYDH